MSVPSGPAMLNLDARYYVEPALYERERQAVFARSWQMLGPAAQLAEAGDYLAVEIAGWKVFVIRGRDGELRAFHNVCRHRGARLLPEGTGRCQTLRCPYHLWLYDEQGNLRKAPYFGEDPGFRLEDYPLQPVSLRIWRGLLFVAIDPAEGLEVQLGALIGEMADVPMETYTATHVERFRFSSNWKIYTDNFVEGYHIPGIHPGFIKVIDFDRFETIACDGMVRMSAPQRDGSFYGGVWLWMWPNWTLSTFPNGMNTSRIDAIGPGETELTYHFYFADTSPESAAARDDTVQRNCAVVREDFGICEETQKNYASGGFRTGPLSPLHERGVGYFQQRLLRVLDA